ncbi:MAG: methyltransferase type 12 [Pseudomonadota bacterium]
MAFDRILDSDKYLFWTQMLRRPARIVALSPSSTDLADAMTAGLGTTSGPVIELGVGTGKITEAMLRRGVPEHQLHLFEIDAKFAAFLRRRFPGAKVHEAPAQTLQARGVQAAEATISGLPLLSMPGQVQHDIVDAAFGAMRPGGRFVQFTYGTSPPIERAVRDDLRLTWRTRGRVWRNLPPAQVYEFYRMPG